MNKSMKSMGFLVLALASAAHAGEEDIKWSGYLNLVGGMLKDKPVSDDTTDEQRPGFGAYENRFTGMQDSLFALQASKVLNNKLSITGQMVARGGAQDSFTTNAEWAYVTYQIDNNSTLRAGRLHQPTFFYSDFVDVGTAYNWVTPPLEVYSFNIGYEGINYLRRDTLGSVDLTTEIFGGAHEQNLSASTGPTAYAHERDIFGSSFTLNYGDWFTTRLMLATATVKLSIEYDIAGLLMEKGFSESTANSVAEDATKFIDGDYSKWDYGNLTVKTDFDRWYWIAEGMVLKGSMELPFKQTRWYTSAGYRVGKAVYHLTYAKSSDDAGVAADYFTNPISVAVVQSLAYGQAKENHSVTLGVRIDTTRTTALKFDLMKFEEEATDKAETSGIGDNVLLRAAFSASF